MTIFDTIGPALQRHLASRFAVLVGVVLLVLGLANSGLSPSVIAAAGAAEIDAGAANSAVKQTIQARIAELETSDQPDAAKDELAKLRQALDFVKQAASSEEAAARFSRQADNAPAVVRELESEVAAPIEEPDMSALVALPLDQLTPKLEEARTQLEAERTIRAGAEEDSRYRNERRQQIPIEVAQIRERLALLKSLDTQPPKGEAGDEAEATRLVRDAERAFLEARTKELDQEVHSYDVLRDLLRLRKQLAEKRVLQAERHFTALESVVSAQRAQLAEGSRRLAEEQRRKAADAHPVVQRVAEENESMATALADFTERSKTLSTEKKNVDDRLQRLRKSFEGAKDKVERVGLTDAIGIHLRNQRLQLPDERGYARDLKARAQELNAVQLRRIELEDTLLDLVDVDAQVQRRLTEIRFDSADERAQIEKSVKELLSKQKSEYAPALARALDIYFDEILVPLHESERQLLETARQYREFIDERVLWVQSARAVNLGDFVSMWDSMHFLLVNPAWINLAWGLLGDVLEEPVPWLLFVGIVAAHVSQRKRIREAIHAAGERAKRKFKARLLDTFVAAACSVLAMLAIPLIFAFLAWRIGLVADTAIGAAVADALERLAIWCLMPLFLQQLVRVNGIADSHFRWSEHVVRLLRRQMRWYVPVGMTLYALSALTFEQPLAALRDSFGRLTFMGLMGCTFILAYRLFHPTDGLFKNLLAEERGGWLNKLRYVWYPLLLAIPLGMIGAVAAGYFYTAINLQQQVFGTAAFVLVAVFCREFALRWLELEQRRMALDQARRRFAAMTKAREEGAGDTSQAELPVPEAEINVAAVSAQTQRLVNFMVSFAVMVGAVLIWKDVLPALGFLGNIELWSHTMAVAADTAGKAVAQLVPVTLGDLLLALIFLIVAVLVSHNIPGLLEILILQHLPITPGARYAVTTVVRYALMTIGVLMAFGAIGIGWSKVQWLAAAITVGLGFGLQEIFANFVSGLIILFERPIRVGDAVTVGGVSGKVTQIRMRATTITDWDRKEVIIPNKTFVTGDVTNWSLSDTILRVTIRVGVAYGSDTNLAARLLVETAKKHPTVLVDPPPTAYFIAFGDNTLGLELRVFVPTPDDSFPVRHDLLTAIDKAFKEAGIEIAFPQRDLHIRSVDEAVLRRLQPGV